MPLEVGQGTVLETVGHSLAADGLLAHASNHLRYINIRTLGATERHYQGAICGMQFGEAGLGRLLTDTGEFPQHNRLQGLGWGTAGLALQGAILELFDILVALGIAALQQ